MKRGMVFHDYLADKVAEIEVVIEDLESVTETADDCEALARLKELRARLRAAREHYTDRHLFYV